MSIVVRNGKKKMNENDIADINFAGLAKRLGFKLT